MARKAKLKHSDGYTQLSFESVIQSARILSRDQVAARGKQEDNNQEYSPVAQTTEYMRRAVHFEEAWETTIQKARDALLRKDPRELYFEFLVDLTKQVEQNSPRSSNLAHLLEQVAIRGLGIKKEYLSIYKPQKGGNRWRINFKTEAIQKHIDEHIVGEYFLNPIKIIDQLWHGREPLIGASDVSQHRSAVPVPARFFKRSVPFVLNNAAGSLFRLQAGKHKYDNVFNPRPDEALLRWMLIDPSYQDELEPEDYQRCLASAMDVGQYKFDLEYLLKADKTPDIIFRDGSLFPQDAYLDNYIVENKRGDFTREAIREMLDCFSYAKQVGVLYCGVTKNVQLKVYSAVTDWFIARYIDRNWEIGNYTLNDGQAMSTLLATPAFVGSNLQETVSTCLIRRSFTTRANLNTRADLDNLDAYFQNYESQHDVDIKPFRRLCDMAHVYMFFVGHSKSPQQQLPRYEFFLSDVLDETTKAAEKVLWGIQHCGLMIDEDHSFMADRPIVYLLPSVTQQAHILSRDVGKYIDTSTGQWIMARYKGMLPK
ncbi:MAG: hypothetical protein AB1894_07265 [Chloroflexota bacterium]